MIIEKKHTAEVRKILKKIFTKKDGWKFSVTKRHCAGVDISILEAPLDLVKDLKEESIINNFWFRDKYPTGWSDEQLDREKKIYIKRLTEGYGSYSSSFKPNSDTYNALALIDDVISFAIAPQRTSYTDGDYGNIPNYYKQIRFGKYNKKLKLNPTVNTITNYYNKLEGIKKQKALNEAIATL